MLLNEAEVIGVGFTVAFTIVQARPRIKLFMTKPFNCLMCMSAWSTFGAALGAGYGWSSLLFIPVGYFVGALFDAIKMRWL